MPVNPVSDIQSAGRLRIGDETSTAGPSEEFSSILSLDDDAFIYQFDNQGVARFGAKGDGRFWCRIIPGAPGSLVSGDIFLTDVTGTTRLRYVDTAGATRTVALEGSDFPTIVGITNETRVVDSFTAADVDSVTWEVTAVRTDVAGDRYTELHRVTHDGAAVYPTSFGLVLTPGSAGEISFAIVWNAGTVELQATQPGGSSTWDVKVNRISSMSV